MVDLNSDLRLRLSGSDLQNTRYLQTRTTHLLSKRLFIEAFQCLEQTLRMNRRISNTPQTQMRVFVNNTTREALEAMRQTYGLTDVPALVRCLHHLEKSLSLLEVRHIPVSMCDLYSSLAAAYRLLPNPHLARSFWEKALVLAQQYPEAATRKPALYLSLCAVMTELKQHNQALQYAKKGLSLALERFHTRCSSDIVSLVAIGYHNVAVQEERLKRFDKAMESYKLAVKVLEETFRDAP